MTEKTSIALYCINGGQDEQSKFIFRSAKNTFLAKAVGAKAEKLNSDTVLHSLRTEDAVMFEVQGPQARDWSQEKGQETATGIVGELSSSAVDDERSAPTDITGGPCHCQLTGTCDYPQEDGTPWCLYCRPEHWAPNRSRCACPCRACDPDQDGWSTSEDEAAGQPSVTILRGGMRGAASASPQSDRA